MAEEGEEVEIFEETALEPWESTPFGVWAGDSFFLRSFPVWYRWRIAPVSKRKLLERPEAGEIRGVHFQQTMGHMVLWHDMSRFGAISEEDICVEMSCWQLQVQVGRHLEEARGRLTGGQPVEELSGELWGDIRLRLSWWELQQDDVGLWLVIYLTKLEHRAWSGLWFTDCFNPHKRLSFPWQDRQTPAAAKRTEDEKLARVYPGCPEDAQRELSVGLTPERICTGLEEDEDEYHVFLTLHLDEEAVENAGGQVPMEELFAADVHRGGAEVYLRYEELGLCSGTFRGHVEPSLSGWEITSVRRKNVPKAAGIRCPAFFNPALRIKLVKAPGHQRLWGGVFAERQTAEFDLPRERTCWTDRVQRALVLSPGAPLKATAKVQRARALCTRVDCSQDTVTQRATLLLHLEPGLEEQSSKFRVDLTTFFSLKVAERMLDVGVVADCEYTMLVGRLGGAVVPERTTWEIVREKDEPGSEKEHLALRISLAKAPGSQDRWPEVFERLEPWQVSELNRPAALADGHEAGEFGGGCELE